MTAPVALILGAGSNVGQAVARAFAAEGYRIALVARSAPKDTTSTEGFMHIRGDLADPSSVAGIFAQVKAELGAPQVVVYNGV
jgi:NAD(P)-dependent dehydrogenase (short-subunit alcohol dehydrogenase family)